MKKTKSIVINHYYNTTSLYNCTCIYLYEDCYFSIRLWVCLVSFHFTFQDSLEYFMQARSNVISLFMWECLYFSLSFEGCRILGWQFFLSFSTLNILTYYLLASKASDEKSAHFLIEYPLCVWFTSLLLFSRFILCLLKILL